MLIFCTQRIVKYSILINFLQPSSYDCNLHKIKTRRNIRTVTITLSLELLKKLKPPSWIIAGMMLSSDSTRSRHLFTLKNVVCFRRGKWPGNHYLLGKTKFFSSTHYNYATCTKLYIIKYDEWLCCLVFQTNFLNCSQNFYLVFWRNGWTDLMRE